jgi:hypothetical protein
MASLIATLARVAFGLRPELLCDAAVWSAGVAELRRRAGGRRESGAFLLGSTDKRLSLNDSGTGVGWPR